MHFLSPPSLGSSDNVVLAADPYSAAQVLAATTPTAAQMSTPSAAVEALETTSTHLPELSCHYPTLSPQPPKAQSAPLPGTDADVDVSVTDNVPGTAPAALQPTSATQSKYKFNVLKIMKCSSNVKPEIGFKLFPSAVLEASALNGQHVGHVAESANLSFHTAEEVKKYLTYHSMKDVEEVAVCFGITGRLGASVIDRLGKEQSRARGKTLIFGFARLESDNKILRILEDDVESWKTTLHGLAGLFPKCWSINLLTFLGSYQNTAAEYDSFISLMDCVRTVINRPFSTVVFVGSSPNFMKDTYAPRFHGHEGHTGLVKFEEQMLKRIDKGDFTKKAIVLRFRILTGVGRSSKMAPNVEFSTVLFSWFYNTAEWFAGSKGFIAVHVDEVAAALCTPLKFETMTTQEEMDKATGVLFLSSRNIKALYKMDKELKKQLDKQPEPKTSQKILAFVKEKVPKLMGFSPSRGL